MTRNSILEKGRENEGIKKRSISFNGAIDCILFVSQVVTIRPRDFNGSVGPVELNQIRIGLLLFFC
jgi:hypothetical protein